jgi:hypothetical protein
MNMSLILEGPDGGGKTTLLSKIREQFGVDTMVHHGAYIGDTNIAQYYMESLQTARRGIVTNKSFNFVMDRSWLAEPIYGTAMRGGENRIALGQQRVLEETFAGLGGLTGVVLCLPPLETCLANWAARREREYPDSEARLTLIYTQYLAAIEEWRSRKLFVYVYDYTIDPSAGDLMKLLKKDLYDNA